jgi:zinc protease
MRIRLTLLVFVVLPTVAQAQEAPAPLITYPTYTETLANGLKTIVISMPGTGLVSYWSIVRTGSRDEVEPGYTGFAHFFEHMMFRGTERYPADAYNDALTAIGASRNAYTTDDLTAYYISVAAEDLERVMDLESDRFRNLAYPESDFRTEAGAVYGEYRKNVTNPLFAMYEALLDAAFDTHTYGHTTMGYEEDIAAMPSMYEYSLGFFSRFYRPDNTILLIVGDVEAERTMAEVRERYGDWQAGYAAPAVPEEPEQTEPRHIDVSFDGRTLPVVAIAYKLDAFDPANRDRVAADLLVETAFGPTSDIYKRLVIDEQVVEFLAADADRNRDPGLLMIYSRVKDPERIGYVLDAIEATTERYKTTPVEDEALAALKSRLRYGFLMGLETPDAVARGLARMIGIAGDLAPIEALYRVYETMTPADVQRAAETYFDTNKRTIAVLRASQ